MAEGLLNEKVLNLLDFIVSVQYIVNIYALELYFDFVIHDTNSRDLELIPLFINLVYIFFRTQHRFLKTFILMYPKFCMSNQYFGQ